MKFVSYDVMLRSSPELSDQQVKPNLASFPNHSHLQYLPDCVQYLHTASDQLMIGGNVLGARLTKPVNAQAHAGLLQ